MTAEGRPSSPADSFILRRYLRRQRASFFFSPGYNAPLGTPCRFAFCIHDLNHLSADGSVSVAKQIYYRTVIRPAISRATVVFTVSEFSRREIIQWSGVVGDRVVNVGNGISDEFRPATVGVGSVGRPYFLSVTNARPYKNTVRSIQAFVRSGLSKEFDLLITGQKSPETDRQIGELSASFVVKYVGPLSDSSLAELYRGAAALLFPSLYEGFGLPIVEAMACGTPVITSNVTAMPEVAGDAALLVDPRSVDEISAAMRRLVSDQELRQSLIRKGLQRAGEYSWERVSATVLAALG